MSLKSLLVAGALACLPTLATAQILVEDPYARSASAMAITGAAFMAVTNPTDTDDRILAARSDISERVELHTHITDDAGVMRMVELEDGIPLPAGETVMLQRGGLHVMFLGLREPLAQGDEIEITLEFEHAAPLTVTLPVDLERMPAHGGGMGMQHGNGNGAMHGSDG
jgi:copper(I)-binding protein